MPDAGSAAGEAGGIFAGIVALLYAVGKGLAWVVNWRDARALTRSAKLDKWHDELEEKEKLLAAKIEQRMTAFETQVTEMGKAVNKWRMAFHMVAAELLQRNPHSMALMQAQKILAEDFPLLIGDAVLPPDMADSLRRLDEATRAAE